IPFYLAHPRLMKLEEQMMMEVEGGDEAWAMRLLRHEMGHVMNHAYHLEKKREWQKLFGSPSDDYSEFYRARPYSKRFVRHLDDWYAQSHPEEDFSETFAIWLTPGLNWRKKYTGWKALEKLEYVDRLMSKLEGKKPLVLSRERVGDASRLRSRLVNYYRRKRRLYDQDLPDFFDADLGRLFTHPGEFPKGEKAHLFLRNLRRPLLESVSRWTGEPKLTVNRILTDLFERCKELDLRVVKDADQTRMEITAYLATMATHYRLTGRLKKR
ncbi:MAG TPA: putative zinc-binding metallopeptidase, partial [Nitrospiria bacterium]